MRNPEFLARLRRQAEMMQHHPENDAIDYWDWGDLRLG
jgi:hypothetical protein